MSAKIGILGGTFDPAHNGHLCLADAAWTELQLDRLVFVPNARSPLKSHPSTSFVHRLAMLKLATEDRSGYEVSDIEGRQGGVSYTIETLRQFNSSYPGAELFLIVGADALEEFHLWREHEEILRLARLAYVRRTGATTSTRFPARAIPMTPVEISATEIRERLRRHESIDTMVPQSVARYISEHHLYGT